MTNPQPFIDQAQSDLRDAWRLIARMKRDLSAERVRSYRAERENERLRKERDALRDVLQRTQVLAFEVMGRGAEG